MNCEHDFAIITRIEAVDWDIFMSERGEKFSVVHERIPSHKMICKKCCDIKDVK